MEQLSGEPLKTHCEMAALRMLLEAVIATLPEDRQLEVVQRFDSQCEGQRTHMLNTSSRDDLLEAMDAAIHLQRDRLVRAGIAPPWAT